MKRTSGQVYGLLFALVAACNITAARAQTDTLSYELEGSALSAAVNRSGIRNDSGKTLEIESGLIESLPKFLGTSDPLNIISFLPGIQTVAEYQSGIHICGGENSQNSISAGGIPVFGAKHLLGLFSVFNTSHYSGMTFSRTTDLSSNRIGGVIDMGMPDTTSRTVSGEISAGLIAAQGSLRLRLGKKTFLAVSARQSFMNLVYGRWMKIDKNSLDYNFGDYNATLNIIPDKHNRVTVDLYFGRDKAAVTEKNYGADISMKWGNALAALHWDYEKEDWKLRNSLFCSGFLSEMSLDQSDISLALPSHIATAGLKSRFEWKNMDAGADISFYDILPQAPAVSGNINISQSEAEKQKAIEASLFASYEAAVTENLKIEAGIKGTLFRNPERHVDAGASPQLSLSYDLRRGGKLSLEAGYKQQYLFQTGLSNAGLPVEFWFVSGKHSRPQSSLWADLGHSVAFAGDAFILTSDIYFKRLFNQTEYRGTLFDFLNASYNLDDYLLKGKGVSYGASIMFQKVSGKLTGWVSYAFGRALRTFDHPDYPGVYPASHERMHEVNAVCNCNLDRWKISGAFVFSSGAPFTAPEYLYMTSGSIITKYGEYNGCRMRPYSRLDISAGYTVFRKKQQSGEISVSIYNVYARANDVMYRLASDKDAFAYLAMPFMLKIIPSISYYHKF